MINDCRPARSGFAYIVGNANKYIHWYIHWYIHTHSFGPQGVDYNYRSCIKKQTDSEFTYLPAVYIYIRIIYIQDEHYYQR